MNTIKKFFTSKEFETFLWISLNGFIALVSTQLADVNAAWAIPVVAGLSILTKYINVNYIKK